MNTNTRTRTLGLKLVPISSKRITLEYEQCCVGVVRYLQNCSQAPLPCGTVLNEVKRSDVRRSWSGESYFSSLGSQSSPGRSCRAVCRTSSLSTNKLRRCSACTMATRIHSMRGGSRRKGLQRREKTHLYFSMLNHRLNPKGEKGNNRGR